MDDDEYKAYLITYIVLTGAVALPMFVLWVVSFFTCRTNRDPARRPFTILKVAFPFFALGYMTLAVSQILAAVQYFGDYYSYYDSANLQEASNHLQSIGQLFTGLGLSALLLCIVDLGLSFLYIWSGNRKHHMAVFGAVAFLALVLAILSLALFGQNEAYLTSLYSSGSYYNSKKLSDAIDTMQKLVCAFDILLWILSLGTTALSIYVFYLSRQQTELRRNADAYLAIGSLFLLSCTYYFAFDVKYVLGDQSATRSVPMYFNVLTPVLSIWPLFIVLVLIFTIGSRKRHAFQSVEVQPKQQYYVPTPVMYYQAPPTGQQHYQVPPNMQQTYQPAQAQQTYQAPHVQHVA